MHFIFWSLTKFYLKTNYTRRCSVKSYTIYNVKLMLIVHVLFRNKQYSERPILDSPKSSPENFAFWKKAKWFSWDKLLFVICRVFRAASFAIFCFFEKKVFGEKKMKYEKRGPRSGIIFGNWSLRILLVLNGKNCIYNIYCPFQTVEFFTLHSVVYFVLFKTQYFRCWIRKKRVHRIRKTHFFARSKLDRSEFCRFSKQVNVTVK